MLRLWAIRSVHIVSTGLCWPVVFRPGVVLAVVVGIGDRITVIIFILKVLLIR